MACKLTAEPVYLLPRSDREVYPQHAILLDLQLRQQDHSSAAVAVHPLPVPSPGRGVREGASAIRGWPGGVRLRLRQCPHCPFLGMHGCSVMCAGRA